MNSGSGPKGQPHAHRHTSMCSVTGLLETYSWQEWLLKPKVFSQPQGGPSSLGLVAEIPAQQQSPQVPQAGDKPLLGLPARRGAGCCCRKEPGTGALSDLASHGLGSFLLPAVTAIYIMCQGGSSSPPPSTYTFQSGLAPTPPV